VTVTWHEHSVAYAAMKWPHAAAHTRAGIADALATITPALVTTSAGRPPAAVLYAHAYNPSRPAPPPGTAAARALAWAERHSLPLTGLTDPQVTRRALDALTVRLDGRRAGATTVTRKRAVFHGAAGYALELGLLPASPLDNIRWKPPGTVVAADRRAVASPAQVQAILAEISRSRPQLTAFVGCLYLAALRPEEAVALREACCHLPASGWGLLVIDAAAPRAAAAWTANGTGHEHRGLKQRPAGTTRAIPIPPGLVRLLGNHLRKFGTAEDGRPHRTPPDPGHYPAAHHIGPDLLGYNAGQAGGTS
jgi:integrase